jgi:hypothetical protein
MNPQQSATQWDKRGRGNKGKEKVYARSTPLGSTNMKTIRVRMVFLRGDEGWSCPDPEKDRGSTARTERKRRSTASDER